MTELSKYRNAFPWGLGPLLLRYLRLHARPLLKPRPAPSDGHRVVISLTTLPSRLPGIRTCLASLLDQTRPADELVLALPERSHREGRGYTLPGWLQGVRVLACECDWGPATKFIPTLQQEGPRTLVLVVDDDNVYPADLVETLLRWHQRFPDAALGYRGWELTPTRDWRETETLYGTGLRAPRRVDVVTGTWGVLVQPRFFRTLAGPVWPEDAFFVDDIWLNGQLAAAGVERWLVPGRLPPLPTVTQWKNDLGRRENADGRRNNAVIASFSW